MEKGIAESIIEGTDATEETEEVEEVSIDEEFEGYIANIDDIKRNIRQKANKLRGNPKTPATKEELASILDVLAGDILDLLGDITSSTGDTLTQLVEVTEEFDEEGEGEEAGGDDAEESETAEGIGEDTVQVYTTLLATAEFLSKQKENFSEEAKAACEGLIKMQEAAMVLIEAEFSAEELRSRAMKLMEQASAI